MTCDLCLYLPYSFCTVCTSRMDYVITRRIVTPYKQSNKTQVWHESWEVKQKETWKFQALFIYCLDLNKLLNLDCNDHVNLVVLSLCSSISDFHSYCAFKAIKVTWFSFHNTQLRSLHYLSVIATFTFRYEKDVIFVLENNFLEYNIFSL